MIFPKIFLKLVFLSKASFIKKKGVFSFCPYGYKTPEDQAFTFREALTTDMRIALLTAFS